MSGQTPIFVLSDATAETGERVLRAALIQFAGVDPDVRIFSMLRSQDEIANVLDLAVEKKALIVHTLVNPLHRYFLSERVGQLGLMTVDIIGQLMTQLSLVLGQVPSGMPGIPKLTDDYFRRIEAVEFAVKHDDGQSVQNLRNADIILVGLSRTSKTPLSTYLAQKSCKVANVPIVLGLPLPEELETIDQDKIFGLTIELKGLIRIRRARLKGLNMPINSDYGRRDQIIRELEYARSIFDAHPHWPVIDVSEKAIEETASIVLRIMEERQRQRAAGA